MTPDHDESGGSPPEETDTHQGEEQRQPLGVDDEDYLPPLQVIEHPIGDRAQAQATSAGADGHTSLQDVIETTPKSGEIDSGIGDGNAQQSETTSGTDDTHPHSEVSKSLRPVPQANQGAGECSSTSDHGPHANQGAGGG